MLSDFRGSRSSERRGVSRTARWETVKVTPEQQAGLPEEDRAAGSRCWGWRAADTSKSALTLRVIRGPCANILALPLTMCEGVQLPFCVSELLKAHFPCSLKNLKCWRW